MYLFFSSIYSTAGIAPMMAVTRFLPMVSTGLSLLGEMYNSTGLESGERFL